MSYYVIAIGGTGAKCVEALTHLSAAGLMPEGDLFVLFADPDKPNGNLERARTTLVQYVTCKSIKVGNCDLFKTIIHSAKPEVWSPFDSEYKSEPSLSEFFRYEGLRISDKAAAALFSVLYSPDERTTTLNKGFRGHPSIGAAVFAETVKLGNAEPWTTLKSKILNDLGSGQPAKIFVFASIFGGTGASGFPTIPTLIRKEFENDNGDDVGVPMSNKLRIGGALMLPYFSFSFGAKNEEMKAKSENFLSATQAGLEYYYYKSYQKVYNAMYLLGNETQSNVSVASTGGSDQKNDPHFVELYAGLAAIDFFCNDPASYFVVGRKDGSPLTWNDLPYRGRRHKDNNEVDMKNVLRTKLTQLTRFAFSYLSTYYPMIKDIKDGIYPAYHAPWFVNLIQRKQINLRDDNVFQHLVDLKVYLERYLRWLVALHGSAKGENIQLFNCGGFAQNESEIAAEFDLNSFPDLSYPVSDIKTDSLDALWEKMSIAKVRDPAALGIGQFVRALYDSCVL